MDLMTEGHVGRPNMLFVMFTESTQARLDDWQGALVIRPRRSAS